MPEVSTDVWEICRTQGSRAAYVALNEFLERPMRTWGKKSIQDLERWATEFFNHQVWPLAVLSWIALLLILKAGGEEEKRAYFFNDLGTAFYLTLDSRCFLCFHKALRLTKSPGRRMRTLRRAGRATAVISRDYEKARRWFKAAIFVGEHYRLDPDIVEKIKADLEHIELRFEPIRLDLEAHKDPCLVDMLKSVDPGEF
jgi:hypothetical protein